MKNSSPKTKKNENEHKKKVQPPPPKKQFSQNRKHIKNENNKKWSAYKKKILSYPKK